LVAPKNAFHSQTGLAKQPGNKMTAGRISVEHRDLIPIWIWVLPFFKFLCASAHAVFESFNITSMFLYLHLALDISPPAKDFHHVDRFYRCLA
jgi:hypothetical protein